MKYEAVWRDMLLIGVRKLTSDINIALCHFSRRKCDGVLSTYDRHR